MGCERQRGEDSKCESKLSTGIELLFSYTENTVHQELSFGHSMFEKSLHYLDGKSKRQVGYESEIQTWWLG